MKRLASAATFITLALGLFPFSTRAQLIPDNTLSNSNSRVINPVNINGLNRDLIEGGVIRGTNLFHSFQEFNVGVDNSVYFANPVGIQNILTRVTGANPSNISGTLGVLGNANLYFINPNGIIFGPEARLDLNGAFIGSTAAEIQLGNSGSFSAIAPINSNLLDVNPSALFFNALAREQITVRGNLEVATGQTLGLFGGNILVDGGRIQAPSGQIFLGAINSGTANLDINNNTVNYSGVNSFGDIQIIRAARVRAETIDLPGKGIDIAANNLLVNGGSRISVNTSGAGNGGDLNIDARNIEVSGFTIFNEPNNIDPQIDRSQITADVTGRQATGNGGNININTDNLSILNSGRIRANTRGQGNGGNVNIRANNLVEVSGFAERRLANGNIDRSTSEIEADVNSTATGNGGTINISSNSLLVANRADIQAQTSGVGNGGTVNINSNSLLVAEGADIETQTSGPGNGGTINIRSNLIEVRDPSSDISADINGTGRGGRIIIHTNTLRVSNEADIQVRTEGAGNARDPNQTTRDRNNPLDYSIYIQANNLVEITGTNSDIRASVNQGATGNGGNVLIDTDTLRISNEGDIQLDTRGAGNSGSLDIFTRLTELISGGGIESDIGNLTTLDRTNTGAIDPITGNSGDINITTDILNINNAPGAIRPRSEIATENFGQGQVGRINVNANFVNLDNGFIGARTAADRNGGNINLNIGTLLTLRNGSEIRANARDADNRLARPASGSPGNITINSPFIIAFPRNNGIVTSAPIAAGGDITISTQAIFGYPQFLILDANGGGGELGIDGTINLETADINPGSILRQLESTPIDVAAIVARDICRLEDGKIAGGSSFIVTGKGGLPPTPATPINSYQNLLDWVDINSENNHLSGAKLEENAIQKKSNLPQKEVSIEAKGWVKRADGKIVLTANPISGSANNPSLVHPSCTQ